MTEDQIERQVSLLMDKLDREYLAGRHTEAEYGTCIANINLWAADQLRVRTPSDREG